LIIYDIQNGGYGGVDLIHDSTDLSAVEAIRFNVHGTGTGNAFNFVVLEGDDFSDGRLAREINAARAEHRPPEWTAERYVVELTDDVDGWTEIEVALADLVVASYPNPLAADDILDLTNITGIGLEFTSTKSSAPRSGFLIVEGISTVDKE
jgi:hypothetical protein